MAVTKRLRYEILRRDNNTCRYCGATPPDVVLTIDHVTPKALGGSDDPSNLVTACKPCNDGKSSVPVDAPLVADVQRNALLWAKAIEGYNKIQAAKRQERDRYATEFEKAWDNWHHGFRNDPIPRDGGWLSTIWTFHDQGLPIEEVLDAVQIACGNSAVPAASTWRYFCGVAWKRVKAIQEGARELLDEARADPEDEHGLTADYQAGWSEGYRQFSFNDIPHRALTDVIDGRDRWSWSREFRWTA